MKSDLMNALKKRATEMIAGLQSKGRILRTRHGEPAAHLVSFAPYDELNRRLSVIEGIALGEQAVNDGRIYSRVEAKRRLSKWLR